MVRNTARTAPKKAPVAFEEPEDDWQPLHPLHRRLVDEYSGASGVRQKPRYGVRLAVVAALAIASWGVVLVVAQLVTAAF